MINLKNEWIDLCHYLGVNDSSVIEHWWVTLATLYSEEHRYYHNLDHVASCLIEYESIKHEVYHPMDVKLAIWFHDACYDPMSRDNEEKSVELFLKAARDLGLSTYTIKPVKELILATKHTSSFPEYRRNLNNDISFFLDIDLSILGQSKEVFLKYNDDIRKEYAWVDEEEYNEARGEILSAFLGRDSIFNSFAFRKKYELSARKNIESLFQGNKET